TSEFKLQYRGNEINEQIKLSNAPVDTDITHTTNLTRLSERCIGVESQQQDFETNMLLGKQLDVRVSHE
ncbi:hypothetical protein NL478_27390, partial [Klebsiella pneumoniae]|nr:hypothetical protein [Klebsiella pneumoniae]